MNNDKRDPESSLAYLLGMFLVVVITAVAVVMSRI